MAPAQGISNLAESVIRAAVAAGVKIATAESCTGGLVAASLTDIAGASAVFERGFIAYSNESKTELLGVAPEIIAVHGAVSGETARAMAEGARAAARADIAISVTGIAGPDGGGPDKPVGLVWFGLAARGAARAERRLFAGASRALVRARSVETALLLLQDAIAAPPCD